MKQLQFFKFEPSLWTNGNIQMCDAATRGLFIDICAMYWIRQGDLPEALVIQKICGGNAVALRPLYDHKIMAKTGENISIKFLDEQLENYETYAKQQAENARKRWDNAKPMRSHKNGNAKSMPIREEKINKKTNKKSNETLNWVSLVDFYNSITGKKSRVVPDKVKQRIKKLLEVYTKADLKTAMENCAADPYHVETGYKHFTLEFISRQDKFDKYLNVVKPKNSGIGKLNM